MINRARSLTGELDWQCVFALAEIHGVTPLVHRFIAEHGAGCIAESARSDARARFLRICRRSTKFARTLTKVARAIEGAGVPMIALKGPALAVQQWADPAMREYSDLDLLVRREDLRRVAALLEESGYRPRRYAADAPGGGAFFDFESEFTMGRDDVAIDLHVELAPTYFQVGLDLKGVWRRAVRVEVEGERIATLCPSDAAHFVAAHAAKHGWRSLGFVCDFAALVNSCGAAVDWDSLLNGNMGGGKKMLRLAVILAEDMVRAPIPSRVSAGARRDAGVVSLARKIESRIFDATGDDLSLFHDWEVPLRGIDGIRNRVRYALGRAFWPTAEDREFVALPRSMYWAYYLTRPLRIARLHGNRLFRPAPAHNPDRIGIAAANSN